MQPFTLLIKPSGSDCNIDCTYCFYKERAPQFGKGKQRMAEPVLEKLVEDYMRLGFPVAGFAWQGGEPTLMGIDFFKKAVELQKGYGTAGQQVSNTMQTNAILLSEAWCEFLHGNNFLLGISTDGPEEFHDVYRLDRAGKGTYERTMRAIRNCHKHNVQFNALIVLSDRNVEHPDRLFDFLIENDIAFVQFIPCIETDPATGRPATFSVTAQQYGDFLCRLFDLWYDYGPDKMNIREFDSLTTYYVMGSHTVCTYSKHCAGFVVIEHTGEAFCCEFFVEPRWKLGNILEMPLRELAGSERKRIFARDKARLCDQCLVCSHLDICRGGCMKDRVRLAPGRWDRQSYFCQAYKQFFDYTVPRFMQIAAAIEKGKMSRRTRSAEKVRLKIQ